MRPQSQGCSACSDGADEAPGVDTGQGLCKRARLKWLNIDTSCLNAGDNPTL